MLGNVYDKKPDEVIEYSSRVNGSLTNSSMIGMSYHNKSNMCYDSYCESRGRISHL